MTDCSHKKKGTNNQVTIPIDLKHVTSISVKEIYSKIEIIPLQTNNETFIKDVNKLLFVNNKYFILDKDQKCIFIFDKNGNLISKINKYGKGPGEYNLISDFELNRFTNCIEVLNPQGIINSYDSTGKFINSYKLPIRGRGVHYFKNISPDIVAFYSKSEQKNIILYSKRGLKVINTFFEVPKVVRFSPLQSSGSPFSQFEDKILFYQGFTNDVFELNEIGLKIRYSWDFKLNNINIDKLPEKMEIPKFVKYLLSNDFVHSYLYNYENSNCIFTRFLCGEIWYNLIYDKNKKTYFLYEKFLEKISPPHSTILAPQGVITVVQPLQINKYLNSEILDEENLTKLKNIKATDNPILVYYLFKD
jgi:hypothetical protein